MPQIILEPVVPVWSIVVLMVGALVVMSLTGRRCSVPRAWKMILYGMRSTVFVSLALLLLQPVLRTTRETEDKPTLAVLVDVSASMTDSPASVRQQRLWNLRACLDGRAFKVGTARYNLQWYEFGAELEAVSGPNLDEVRFNAPRTQVMSALNALAVRSRGVNMAGVLLFTDGLDRSIDELTADATAIPVYIPLIEDALTGQGAPAPDRVADVKIDDLQHPKMLVVGWRGQIEVYVRRSIAGQRMVCPVHLYDDDRRIDSANAVFVKDELMQTVRFTIEPATTRRMRYRVEIKPTPDARTDNNERAFMIDIVDPENRLLYLEGTPRWDFKFIKRALLDEKTYHLSAFVRGAEGLFLDFSQSAGQGQGTTLPDITPAELLKYRTVILGEMASSSLKPEQRKALAGYIKNGGGLLVLGGKTAYGPRGWASTSELAPLLPYTGTAESKMREGRFPVTVSAAGQAHPILAEIELPGGFPPVLTVWGPVAVSPGASTLATADRYPLLVVKRYGEGRVAVVLTDSLWRWKLGTGATTDGRSPYGLFITQLMYWLAPTEKEIDEHTDLQIITRSSEYDVRERVVIGAFFSGGKIPEDITGHQCRVKTPDRRTLKLEMRPARLGPELGLPKAHEGLRAEFVPHLPGDYEITVVNARGIDQGEPVRILVVGQDAEQTGAPVDREFLNALAGKTGGKAATFRGLEELLEEIPFEPLKRRRTVEVDLWHQAWVLVLVVAMLCGEWICRARINLL